MTTNASYDLLSSLLPTTSFALAYALPLLFLSLLLTFSGAFLTLDRTRIFPPTEPRRQVASKAKFPWLSSITWSAFLRGGIGGFCSGFAFGVHFTTFLCLVIPNETSSSQLGPKAFLAIWVLSAICCTIFAGRWKYATLILAAATGYATLALAFAVIAHPSLVTRIALVPVFVVLGMTACLLPFPRICAVALRFADASTGSFGLVLSIAILVRNTGWGNVWQRLWVSNGDDWGTSQEKGLSAAYCLLFCLGVACDWFLHIKLGQNPDEKWDRYLAKYADNLPNDGGRAGTFTPFVSLYDRLLGRDRYFAPIVSDQKVPIPPLQSGVSEKSRDLQEPLEALIPLDVSKSQPGYLRKKGPNRGKNTPTSRRAIKFQLDEEDALSSSDDEDYPPARQPFPRSLSSASSATLTNSRGELKPPSRSFAGVPEYSDYEEDVTELSRNKPQRDDPNWTPDFIRRHSQRSAANRAVTPPSVPKTSSADSQQPSLQKSTAPSSPALLGADVFNSVPATPSLIRAVDRIAAAYVSQATPSADQDGLPASSHSRPSDRPWDAFWADVKAKAQT